MNGTTRSEAMSVPLIAPQNPPIAIPNRSATGSRTFHLAKERRKVRVEVLDQ